ncbi:helix-turn-helix domain-containing protein [Micromonospora sp. NPDC000207]|uniref:helix-turn-helix domain-containing protein n=1 Tax=Micromonospora sp. NPDC000207 TaxID=3154246 RepID=UPI00331E46ED
MVDPVAAEVRRLRTEEQLSVRQIRARTGLGRNRVQELLRGVAPPAWTRRPNARDDLRAEAEALRADGCTVPEIATRLGVSKSTAHAWVAHLPLDRDEETERARRKAHSKVMTDAQWGEHRRVRDEARAATIAAGADAVEQLNHRDLVLVGAAIYWAEGTKAKPWRPNDCRVRFVNSDPGLIDLFIRFVEVMGSSREALRYRVSIHETADSAAAVRWWAERVGVAPDAFQPTTLKRHKPTTKRHNLGEDYHGCLVVEVPNSRELYWKIEGTMKGLADGVATMKR